MISLSFSNLGGQEVLADVLRRTTGHRSYEDRIYSHLGEFYLEKLRYADAAKAYQAFVALYPLHQASPHFSMRVVEIYEKGDFPKLVLEAKKEFAATYGLQSEYWRHFAVADSPDVVGYLKTNLKDLASYYHALYQNADLEDQKPESFQEAARWYRGYLTSFPQDPETPAIHYRLADLLLEHEDFGEASSEYERVGLRVSRSTSAPPRRATPPSTRSASSRSARPATSRRRPGARPWPARCASSTGSRSTSRPRRCSARRPTTSTR